MGGGEYALPLRAIALAAAGDRVRVQHLQEREGGTQTCARKRERLRSMICVRKALMPGMRCGAREAAACGVQR